MIVDDEPMNIKLVQKYLSDVGYRQFVTTDDAREALVMVRNERPDVILLDVMHAARERSGDPAGHTR